MNRKSYNQKSDYSFGSSQHYGASSMDRDSRNDSIRFTQTQSQLLRSKEASKQMLYGTFGNVIAILEEFEQREMQRLGKSTHMPKSNIPIPNQCHKSFDDVESNVKTQILLFETHSKACPPEVLAEVKEELTQKTLRWAAVRAEMDIKEIHKTDRYVAKLYEILAKGSTHHQIPDSGIATKEAMRESVQAIMKGNHDKETLDQEFRRDRNRKANAPYTRNSELLPQGAQRLSMARGNKDLDTHLQRDVQRFQRHGPHDLK